MPKVSPPPNSVSWMSWLMHIVLVILAIYAVKIVVHSPNPIVGAVVLALALGVEVPVAAWKLLGGK